LLDFALGRVDAPRRERIERELARHPTMAGRMAQLIRNLGRLLDDGRQRHRCETEPSPPSSPASPTTNGFTDLARPNEKSGDVDQARGTAAGS
jgi:hypothetical protein